VTASDECVIGTSGLAESYEFLRYVKHTVWAHGDANSDVGVFRVEDIGAMIVLEFRFIHEGPFGLRDVRIFGNVLSIRTPMNSRPRNAHIGETTVNPSVTEESVRSHFLGVLAGDGR
jgi:hypothetical protein